MTRVLFLATWIASMPLGAQRPGGTLHGEVRDSSGAVVPGVAVTISGPGSLTRDVQTDVGGVFAIGGFEPGKYTVQATRTGFAPYRNPAVEIRSSSITRLTISLELAIQKQEITVEGGGVPSVNADASGNISAVVLRAAELAAFSDDPAELALELQTLAGAGGGSGNGQLFVDGFTAGRLPPKSTIREVRMNQNPLSAEYDRLGWGRIEVFTKPGSDKLRGEGFFDLNDSIFSSRNPFIQASVPFQQRLFGGNIGGPLNRRASFFLDVERHEIDDDAVVNATVLDPVSLNRSTLNQTVATPNRNTTASPRLDYQLTPSVALTGRYRFTRITQENAGVGTLLLPSRAYNTSLDEHTMRWNATAVLSARAINETRFQFVHIGNAQGGDDSPPAISVLGAFTGGGAQSGRSSNLQNRWELQNYSTFSAQAHSLRFGLRLRGSQISDFAQQNFGGTFTFSGGAFGPALDADGNQMADAAGNPISVSIDSLERYRRTVLLGRKGYSQEHIAELGGGPSQFTLSAGNPLAQMGQVDLGAFLQEDWRVHSNFTLSAGLRYEAQTNLRDYADFAPRLGFAWAPGSDPKRRKTALRGGFGIFYDRFGENLTLQTLHFDGRRQQQFVVSNPSFFPDVPAASVLTGGASPVAIWRVASDARTPYVMQGTVSIERELPWHSSISSTLTWTRGEHTLLARDANAPLPGSGTRPYGPGDILQYESGGILRQIGWNTSGTTHAGKRLALFGMYGYVVTKSDSDGPGTFPANSYDLAADYGRSALDMRHHFEAGGSVTAFHGIRVSPLFNGRSGMPFNITSGRDLNGDGLFTDRPAFAMDPNRPGVAATPYGLLDPNPEPGARVIPRNYGRGPAYVILNLRVSRTFAFGGGKRPVAAGSSTGYQSVFGDAPREKRYSLTASISAHNLLNTVNPDNPVGVVASPLFLQSRALGNYWGPAGEAANRRVNLQVRLSF